MRPEDPYDQPLSVSLIDGEVVFLGPGSASFSMTPEAAAVTFHNLAAVVAGLARSKSMEERRKPRVVLIVDDEPIVRIAGVMVLVNAGYLVIEADSAAEALLVLESEPEIHLLFTDVHMPGDLNGLQLAHLAKSRWPSIGLLISSAEAFPASASLPPGGRFLAKPYDPDEVLRHVGELIAA